MAAVHAVAKSFIQVFIHWWQWPKHLSHPLCFHRPLESSCMGSGTAVTQPASTGDAGIAHGGLAHWATMTVTPLFYMLRTALAILSLL